LETVALETSDAAYSVIPISYWALAQEVAMDVFLDDRGAIGHAGQAETSLMLALRSELVGEITDRVHETVEVELARDRASIDGLGNSGVVGDPGLASAESGSQFFEAVCTELAAIFGAVAERHFRGSSGSSSNPG
jgi:creatinine amidohydrolase